MNTAFFVFSLVYLNMYVSMAYKGQHSALREMGSTLEPTCRIRKAKKR